MEKHVKRFYDEVTKALAGSDEERIHRALRLAIADAIVEERGRFGPLLEAVHQVMLHGYNGGTMHHLTEEYNKLREA